MFCQEVRRVAAGLVLAAGLAAVPLVPVAAQENSKNAVVERLTPDDLERLIRGMGFDVERGEDERALLFRLNDYAVVLYCSETNAQFTAWFDRKGLKKDRATPEYMNRWNRDMRFSRAYIDKDGDPTVEYDVDFEGGVTPENIRVAVRTFREVTTRFAGFLAD